MDPTGGDMVSMDTDHFGIINTCLHEPRLADDQVLSSVAVLQERMERVKKAYSGLAGLSFSSQVQQLTHPIAAAVS